MRPFDVVLLVALAVAEFALGVWVGMAVARMRAEAVDIEEQPAGIMMVQRETYVACADWDVP